MITLSSVDQAVLEERSRAYTARFATVVRAKIVLLAADGEQNTKIAQRLSVHVDVVSTWRKRFFESGLAGLDDRPGRGRPRSFTPEVVAEVKAMACEPPSQREARDRELRVDMVPIRVDCQNPSYRPELPDRKSVV